MLNLWLSRYSTTNGNGFFGDVSNYLYSFNVKICIVSHLNISVHILRYYPFISLHCYDVSSECRFKMFLTLYVDQCLFCRQCNRPSTIRYSRNSFYLRFAWHKSFSLSFVSLRFFGINVSTSFYSFEASGSSFKKISLVSDADHANVLTAICFRNYNLGNAIKYWYVFHFTMLNEEISPVGMENR